MWTYRQYNARVLLGEDPDPGPLLRDRIPRQTPIGCTVRWRNATTRVVECPFCTGEHEHRAEDHGRVRAAPCCDRLYVILTTDAVERQQPQVSEVRS